MAEFLIQAKPHWMDSINPDTLPPDQIDNYNARGGVGDIIVIKPDGWEWGNEERLPNYIVVQIPALDVDAVKDLVQSCWVSYPDPMEPSKTLKKRTKKRRYAIPKTYVEQVAAQGKSVVKINKTQWDAMLIDKENA